MLREPFIIILMSFYEECWQRKEIGGYGGLACSPNGHSLERERRDVIALTHIE